MYATDGPNLQEAMPTLTTTSGKSKVGDGVMVGEGVMVGVEEGVGVNVLVGVKVIVGVGVRVQEAAVAV
jgi:UDP-3-O-[3-hydroxymyristoyl] glucosamine N-acyltransferase